MIAVIKSGSNISGAIKYNLDKVKNNEARFLYAHGFSLENPPPKMIKKEFEQLISICKMKAPVAHISLNFSPNEVISDKLMLTLAREYLIQMGYGAMPYVIYRHEDTAHPHIHIVTVNMIINNNGKLRTLKNSNNFYHSRAVCSELEKKYNLVQAIKKEKNKTKIPIEIIPEPHPYGEVPTYDYLKKVIENTLKTYAVTNTVELNKLLNPYSVKIYANKTTKGERYYKFTFIDPGNRKSIGVSATPRQLKLNYNYLMLQQYFSENKNKLQDVIQNTRKEVKKWLRQYYSLSPADLRHKLKPTNIDFKDNTLSYRGHTLTYAQLGIPSTFLKTATVKKEYYKAFIYTVTEYRKKTAIRYESTLLQNELLMEKMKVFIFDNMNLSKQQIDILFGGYCDYKFKCISEIQQKEHLKDIKWVNSVIHYLNTLKLSDADKLLLAEKIGIKISPYNITIVGKFPEDNHIVELKDVASLMSTKSKKSYNKLISEMTNEEVDIVKGCISGIFYYNREIEYKRLLPLMPPGSDDKLRYAANDIRKNLIKKHLNSFLPNQRELSPGKLLKWDDDDEDEDEEVENQKNRGRNLGIK